MSKERLTIDDPRLTAYVLGELQEPQRTQFEAELAESPQLHAALDELRHAAAQVFAALQTEPGIALTDEQLERIRTAAYAVPPQSPAMSESPPATPARVAIIGPRPRSSVSRTVASSAIVLVGLVLTTAAVVLSPHFPDTGGADLNFSLPDVALLEDGGNWGIVEESLVRHDVSTQTFADDLFLNGPTLNYDELRRAYRIEIPDNNGRVEIQYVDLVSAEALYSDFSVPADAEDSPEQLLAENEAAEQSLLSAFGLTEGDDHELGLNLRVTDANANGRLDDDRLWFAPNSYERSVVMTAPEPPAATNGESALGLEALAAEPSPAPETAGADGVEPDDVERIAGEENLNYYLVFPKLAQQESSSRYRRLMSQLSTAANHSFESPDAVEMDRMHFFEDEAGRFGDLQGGGQPMQDAPAPSAEASPGSAGAEPSVELLRGLVEHEVRSRFRAGAESQPAPAPVSAGESMNEFDGYNRGGREEAGGAQDGAAPAPRGFGADFDALTELMVDDQGQQSPGQSQRGTSGLARDARSDGEPLPPVYRLRLGEQLRQNEAEITERDAEIRRWQRDYSALQSEREAIADEYRRSESLGELPADEHGAQLLFLNRNGAATREEWFGRSEAGLSLDLGVPFQQGSFELGVPDFGSSGNWAYTPGTESYAPIVENDFQQTLTEPVSTFSIDVDTGSYANCRRFINSDTWPPADAVRVEELVNSFAYNDPPPEGEHPIAVNFDVAACPWQPEHRLVRIGVRAADIIRAERPPTRLVFLVDVSGSMQDDNKLPLVQQSLHLLVDELGENDRVAIVTYASDAGIRLESTLGSDRETILAAVDALGADGSTNGEGGLRLAYQVAEGQFEVEASNRVILCSDGDFNVGESDDSELVKLIEQKRDSGVFLSVFGFGTGNLEDAKLEQIADHGNGQYGYIDSLDEAKNVFVHDLTGTLYTVAKDVKLQVDFNPMQVDSYRLIGYENRALENADFDNDVVDAGDVGAGHSVTALYQVAPRNGAEETDSTDLAQAALDRFLRLDRNADQNVRIARDGTVLNIDGTVISDERKQETAEYVTALLRTPAFEGVEVRNNLEVAAAGEIPPAGEDLLKLRVRYKQPNADESRLFEAVLVDDGTMQSPSQDFQWASAVASYGMLLRQSRFRGNANFDAIIETAQAAVGDDPRRREFIELALRSRAIYSRQTGRPSPEPVQLTSVEARDRAACSGKYSDLLEKLEVPEDRDTYGVFRDYGYWVEDSYRSFTGLPAGYWVYVYPHWFIWGEETE